MIIAILAFWLGYKRGSASGRNGALWSVICGFSFLGTQIVSTVAAGAFIGIGIALWGWDESTYDNNTFLLTAIAIVPSFVVLFGIIWFLEKYPKLEDDNTPLPPPPPPPPPTFDNAE